MKRIHLSNFLLSLVVLLSVINFSNASAKESLKSMTSQSDDDSPVEIKEEAPPMVATSPKVAKLLGEIQKHSVGLGIGQTFLLGDFREKAEDSITFDLLYGYSASYSFDMFANFHFSEHEFLKNIVTLKGAVVGIKGKLYSYDAFSPFGLAGLGFYAPTVRREVSDDSWRSSESKVTFGIHFGGGADLRLNDHYSIGVLAQYHDPFDIKQEIGPKVTGSYFKLLITGYYIY